MSKVLISVLILGLVAGVYAQQAVPVIPDYNPTGPVATPNHEPQTFLNPDPPWLANALADSMDYSNPPDGALFVVRKGGTQPGYIVLGYNYNTGSAWQCRWARSTNSGQTYTAYYDHQGWFWVDVCINGNGRDSCYNLAINQPSAGGYHLFIRFSSDYGLTWSDTVRVDRGTSTFTDKPMFTTWGRYLYCTYSDFSGGTNWIRMCRSSDWGRTWNTGDQNISSAGGQGSCPAVNPTNGHVYAVWGQPCSWVPTEIWFNRSTDNGASWSTATRILSLTTSSHLSGWRANHSFPAMSCDATGKIYVTVQNSMRGTGWDICVISSTNGGTTWTAPVRVNDDTNTDSDQYCSWICIDRYNRPHVFWYDSRNYYPTNSGDVYYSYSADGGATWRPNERVNDVTPVWLSSTSSQMGDYQQIDTDSNYVYCEWSDHRNNRTSWSYIAAGRRPLPAVEIEEQVSGTRWEQSRFTLAQNTPNPLVTGTRIAFQLEVPSSASLKVFDLSGKLVASVFEGRLAAGRHSAYWDGTDASGKPVVSGVYFYRLETAQSFQTRKMVVSH